MKQKRKNVTLIAFAVCAIIHFISAPAFSSMDYYSKVGLTFNTVSESFGDEDLGLNMTTLNLVGGIAVSPYIAFEARVGIGLTDDSDDVTVDDRYGPINVEIEAAYENSFGVYFKPQIPVNDNFLFYGLMGYTLSKVKADITGTRGWVNVNDSVDLDGSAIGYGAGVEFLFNNNFGAAIEYARLTGKLSALGAVAKFMF